MTTIFMTGTFFSQRRWWVDIRARSYCHKQMGVAAGVEEGTEEVVSAAVADAEG
jgi:hypothetical protein